MHFLFAPGMACLRPMPNEIKLPFLGSLFLLPTLLAAFLDPTAMNRGIAIGLFLVACYFVRAQYLLVGVMWGSLLGTMHAIGQGDLEERPGAKLGGQCLQAHLLLLKVIRNLGAIVGEARSGAERIAPSSRRRRLSRRPRAWRSCPASSGRTRKAASGRGRWPNAPTRWRPPARRWCGAWSRPWGASSTARTRPARSPW
jgi:hypothetical protein